jgi:predicted  nucleic acid-binding Zn-ribbon protein
MKNKTLTEKELRGIIKKVMEGSLELKEFDALLPKKAQWKDEAAALRMTLVELMKNIENDDFSDGLKKINSAIKHLESWKLKIEKFL